MGDETFINWLKKNFNINRDEIPLMSKGRYADLVLCHKKITALEKPLLEAREIIYLVVEGYKCSKNMVTPYRLALKYLEENPT